MTPNDLLKPSEAADMLRIEVDTLNDWRRSGKLTGIKLSRKVVRYKRSVVENFIRLAREAQ